MELSIDAVNRDTWRRPGTVRLYRKLQGWTDPGEQAAVAHIEHELRGRSLLDIGVGAGRTTALLAPLAGDYTGIDYTAEMVQVCRAHHPGRRIEQMDARDLGAFPDGSMAAAVFSFNGIDSVPYEGRTRVLAEAWRVLQPGGVFVMSAHNRYGPGAVEQPRLAFRWTWNPAKLAWRAGQALVSRVRAGRNHRRLRSLKESHGEWAVRNAAAHDFGIVIVATSLPEQLRQLRAGGFEIEAVYENSEGRRVQEGDDTAGSGWFHYVARKPAGASTA